MVICVALWLYLVRCLSDLDVDIQKTYLASF